MSRTGERASYCHTSYTLIRVVLALMLALSSSKEQASRLDKKGPFMNSDTNVDSTSPPTLSPLKSLYHQSMGRNSPHSGPKKIPRKMSGICAVMQPPAAPLSIGTCTCAWDTIYWQQYHLEILGGGVYPPYSFRNAGVATSAS